MSSRQAFVLVTVMLAALAMAQAQGDKPAVIMAPVGSVQLTAGASKPVTLDFRIKPEFHINSHTPHSELLIPTVLKLDAPDPVALG